MKSSIYTFAVAVLCIAIRAVAAQEPNPAPPDGPYTIARVDFDITGATIEYSLRNKADIKLGTSFPSREELESFIADRRQQLLNERVLASVDASYDATPAPSGGYDAQPRQCGWSASGAMI